jgi:hypothetical protein
MARLRRIWNDWWFEPMPLERWHAFRVLIYLYVPIDVLTSRWVAHHGLVPKQWYQPLWFARALDIPAPTATGMAVATAGLLTLPLVAAAGKGRRVVGPLVALLYFYWCFVAFTYGKVDHDRVALITALAVLPTVAWRGTGSDARAGWALSMVQMSFVLTYFLAGVTKLLVAGPSWVTSTTIERAIARRGTILGDVLLHVPPLLIVMQFVILLWELTTPVMLLRNRLGRIYVYSAIAFHIASLIGITIYFRSHLICVIAFLPLERLWERLARRRSAARAGGASVVDAQHDDEGHALSKE